MISAVVSFRTNRIDTDVRACVEQTRANEFHISRGSCAEDCVR
jgi:hypothetical protein